MTRRLFSVSKLLFLSTILSGTTGSVTLLITGHDTENVHKHNLAGLFVYSYDEIIKDSPSDLHVFTNGIKISPVIDDNHLFSAWSNYELSTNLTTLIVTTIGIDQMNLDQLKIVRRFITNDNALISIEIGKPKTETRALLERHSSCLMRGYALIASPNVVYFCNNASPEMLSNLRFAKLHNMEPSERRNVRKQPHQWLNWPKLFASAVKVEEQTYQGHKQEYHDHHDHNHLHHAHSHHPHHSYHNHRRHYEEDVEEIVDMIMEDIIEQGELSEATANAPFVKEESKREKKKACKYRKSCYETGIKPVITDNSIINYLHWWPGKNEGNEDKEDKMKPYNASEGVPFLKLQCKYRHSCYHKFGIPLKKKTADEEKKKPIRAYKAVPLQRGKQKTLKEIAAEVLKMVEESTKKATKRPLVKTVEKHMTALEEKLSEKLNCKYRKSCYETGEIPHIEEKWSLPLPIKIFSTESVDSENNQINFDELEQLKKKLYCKYRKSCYETGVKPDIEPEIFIGSLKDLTTIYEQVETRKLSLQEKCKYRKSCYESGIVPEINPKLEVEISREVSSVIPTNAQDLRSLCKYRKSCYAKVHDSATVDTVKLIRKRRQIEKEVRRRKAGRAKLHRKLYGEMQLEDYRKLIKKKAPDESIEHQRSIKASKISDKKKTRKQIEEINKEGAEIKERYDGEKQGKVKKSKQEVKKEPALPITTKPKETTLAKKDRKGKKMKLEKQTPVRTLTVESTDEVHESEPAKKEAKPTTPKPLKTGLDEINKECTKEEQDTPEVITGDEKKVKGLGKAVQTMNKLIEEMHHQQEQQQRKEFCKYRKSCYETGEKPEIQQSLHNLLTMFKEHVDRETGEVHVISKTEVEKKLDCKYRKSCYRNDQDSRKHQITSEEVKDKHSATKATHGTYEKENAKDNTKTDYDGRIPTKESLIYTEQKMKSDSMKTIGLERYKKGGKCSPYYYSCREILGLPPKERAPIGPNGRRLCRKKPSSSA